MGSVLVDQIGSDGGLVRDYDRRLTTSLRDKLILEALPGAQVMRYAGVSVIRFRDQVILRKQVTHLGYPWPEHKKRIQIPKDWVDVYRQAMRDGFECRFLGVYHYGTTTIFVDFEPSTYAERKANNSAAHVSTNDLFQAQTLGVFTRTDRNGNKVTSVRADRLAEYLGGAVSGELPQFSALRAFNRELLTGDRIDALDAVKEMHEAGWPDAMQGEWAGFYLEYRLSRFLREYGPSAQLEVRKVKSRGDFDFDLLVLDGERVAHFGDLKASSESSGESLGNDAADLDRCLDQYGRFWYVIYEHETWHSRDEDHRPVMEWNEWRRSVGYTRPKGYDPLSYAGRFKSAVRFTRMYVLEVNEANRQQVLTPFNQGRQPDGSPRAPKVKIAKKNIDNFLVCSGRIGDP